MRYRIGHRLALLCSLVLLLPAGVEGRALQALCDLPDAVAGDWPADDPLSPVPAEQETGGGFQAEEEAATVRHVRQVAARLVKRSLASDTPGFCTSRCRPTLHLLPASGPIDPAGPGSSSALHVLHCVWRC